EFFDQRFDFEQYVGNSLLLTFGTGLIALLLVVVFDGPLSELPDFPVSALWLVPVYCFCHNICELLLSIWRAQSKPVAFGLFRVGRTLLEIGLSVLFVTAAAKGWRGRIDGMLVAAISFGFLALIFLFRAKVRVSASVAYLKDIAKFGAPLIPHTLGAIVMIYSDRLFITKMIGLSETGAYTVGYQVAMAISLLQSSFNLAWVPWFYDRLNQKNNLINRQIVQISYVYFLVILLCALALTLISPLVFRVFIHESFHDAIQFVFWISIGFAFDGMYKMVVNYIFYLKKTYLISIITVVTATLNLILNYFFISWYGAVGAAKATALCMLFEFILVWWMSSRIYPMPWNLKKTDTNP
ncbi:MAG: lipopolysaccharide biosynthesis protein, partial [Bacteroidota bacterium]